MQMNKGIGSSLYLENCVCLVNLVLRKKAIVLGFCLVYYMLIGLPLRTRIRPAISTGIIYDCVRASYFGQGCRSIIFEVNQKGNFKWNDVINLAVNIAQALMYFQRGAGIIFVIQLSQLKT